MTREDRDLRPLAGAAVLLVHGEPEVTERIAASLAARGAAVLCVEEVEQAIAAITLGDVDAIVCGGDCSLDGHGWLERVRMLSDRTRRGIPDRVAALLSRATMRLPRIP